MPDNELIPVERIQTRIVVLRSRSQNATGSQQHRDPALEIAEEINRGHLEG